MVKFANVVPINCEAPNLSSKEQINRSTILCNFPLWGQVLERNIFAFIIDNHHYDSKLSCSIPVPKGENYSLRTSFVGLTPNH